MTITDKAFKSIESGKEYSLKVYFMSGSRVDEGWGTKKAVGIVIDDDGDAMRGVRMLFDGGQFLTDLAIGDTFALFRDDVVVESLTLKGTAPAVAALRACAKIVQKENPADPFED